MNELCRLMWCGLIGFFRSRASLEAEILVLRHQLNILRRKSPKRPTFGSIDRLIFAGLYEAGNRNPLAPRGVSLVLAMEVKIARWSSEAARRPLPSIIDSSIERNHGSPNASTKQFCNRFGYKADMPSSDVQR